MATSLKLHELTGSPNNVKVRIALGYKGLEYERIPADMTDYPGDRSAVLAKSRQPRYPVLEHGSTVVFDSASIIRYLEANFPDTPRLFLDTYQEHGQIEQWELFARTQLSEPINMIFGEALSTTPDANVIAQANRILNERTGAIEDRLTTNDFLVSDQLTAGDLACAAPLYLTDQTESGAASHPIAMFFHEQLHLDDDRKKTRAWVRKVVAYDSVMGHV